MAKSKLTLLQRTILTYVDLYGSYRKAEEKLGINFAYLHRLATGDKTDPTDEVLAKLKLRRRTGIEPYEALK